MIDWSVSATQGLVGYWPFTEMGGRRWRNAVNNQVPVFSSTYPGRWMPTLAGTAMDILQSDSNGQTIKVENVLSGSAQATIGMLVLVQVKDSISSTGAQVVGATTGAYVAWRVCSDGNIDNTCRVDFIASSAYARPNISQLATGSLYTLFATWVSGTNPKVYAGLWPGGGMNELTYFDRGAGAGTIGASTNVVMGLDGNNRAALRLGWLGLWNRPLRVEEMESLHIAPWQMIDTGEDSAYSAVAPAAVLSRTTLRDSGNRGGARQVVID